MRAHAGHGSRGCTMPNRKTRSQCCRLASGSFHEDTLEQKKASGRSQRPAVHPGGPRTTTQHSQHQTPPHVGCWAPQEP